MADDQTVIDHLLLGRQALERDVDRLNAELQRLVGVIEQLDSVIDLVGSSDDAVPSGRRAAPLTRSEPSGVTVNTSAAKAAARSRKPRGNAPKSIRVHVLEMLAAENREWSLSEIIDRIHAEGIQAHDDAVRSITIKLMKDGRVERIGRGQYRLARRGSSRAADAPATTAFTAADEPSTPVDDTLASEDVPDETVSDETVSDETVSDEFVSDDAVLSDETMTVPEVDSDTLVTGDVVDTVYETDAVDGAAATDLVDETATDDTQDEAETRPYTPPLNLGQPWR